MTQPIWITPAGSLGSFPATQLVSVQLLAQAVLPAGTISFKLLSGSLPEGLSLSSDGKIYGTPKLVVTDVTSNFTVRVTDNLQNIRDRSFSIRVTGSALPSFVTPTGSILSTIDSTWVEYAIQYNNPYANNPIMIEVTQGLLPPGLEINEQGLIRGYANPPTDNITLNNVITTATQTISTNNSIVCVSTYGFTVGRPIIFTGTTIGGIVENQTYYIKSIINSTTFTISVTQNGSTFLVNDAVGSMVATLPPISVGTPTIRTYTFTLTLFSPLGNAASQYSITIQNQNITNIANSRPPTILNTRPLTFNLTDSDPYYGYYIVPNPTTINPNVGAPMGTYNSGNYFAFKIIGYDFDGNDLTYVFSNLPSGLTGNSSTGWVQGTPTLLTPGISTYSFVVSVVKSANPSIGSINFNFNVTINKEITGTIIWLANEDLGIINNSAISLLTVEAESDVELQYELTSGSLPPNLSLLNNGQIIGKVAYQPTSELLNQGETTDFEFSVRAYSTIYDSVNSTKSFKVTVLQKYEQPTDILYIKAAPDISDRIILDSLLDNTSLIPDEAIFRPNDINFGKATSVIYEHAYGINASNIDEYVAAITKNHYWRNITLGELKTAIARDENTGEVIYEVVYSEVIDNLVNPYGVSIPETIYWPRRINLNLGPWITSVTNIFTSYDTVLGQQYYTSLTPGIANTLYPNSLYNMRTRVGQELGQVFDSDLLPLWMTSQQENGSTLGYTQAWVICYTKPGFSKIIKENIDNNWQYTLNEINITIDRFTVDKSLTYNYENSLKPPAWTGLPSATPAPNPIDSKDFYVLFPRKTILPNQSQ